MTRCNVPLKRHLVDYDNSTIATNISSLRIRFIKCQLGRFHYFMIVIWSEISRRLDYNMLNYILEKEPIRLG